jgi:hypothetical protein
MRSPPALILAELKADPSGITSCHPAAKRLPVQPHAASPNMANKSQINTQTANIVPDKQNRYDGAAATTSNHGQINGLACEDEVSCGNMDNAFLDSAENVPFALHLLRLTEENSWR